MIASPCSSYFNLKLLPNINRNTSWVTVTVNDAVTAWVPLILDYSNCILPHDHSLPRARAAQLGWITFNFNFNTYSGKRRDTVVVTVQILETWWQSTDVNPLPIIVMKDSAPWLLGTFTGLKIPNMSVWFNPSSNTATYYNKGLISVDTLAVWQESILRSLYHQFKATSAHHCHSIYSHLKNWLSDFA